jgi:hypothetical protein
VNKSACLAADDAVLGGVLHDACLSPADLGLQAGKDVGLAINFHGDELNPMQSGELGAALGARAISHLEHVSGLSTALHIRTRTSAQMGEHTWALLPVVHGPPYGS